MKQDGKRASKMHAREFLEVSFVKKPSPVKNPTPGSSSGVGFCTDTFCESRPGPLFSRKRSTAFQSPVRSAIRRRPRSTQPDPQEHRHRPDDRQWIMTRKLSPLYTRTPNSQVFSPSDDPPRKSAPVAPQHLAPVAAHTVRHGTQPL